MPLTYHDAALGSAETPDPALVRALQADLRALGYLKRGIDGQFGDGTRLAVRRLQHDLMFNTGASTKGDGRAPVAMTAYNRGVTATSGVVDAALADSIAALLADPQCPRLPQSTDPKAANQAAMALIARTASAVAPAPFLLAIFEQESGGQQFAQPQSHGDTDDFVVLGLDFDKAAVDFVKSRGYGLGQYTLFHHPPRPEEVAGIMLDPLRNTQTAFGTLRDKFNNYLVGATDGTRADDRMAEHPLLPLRTCRYAPNDARFLSDCQGCAREAGKLDIDATTPLYHQSPQTYGEAPDYADPAYVGVPNRADFQCDWPYAVRRYNGEGPDSFNYQAKILLNLLVRQPGALGNPA